MLSPDHSVERIYSLEDIPTPPTESPFTNDVNIHQPVENNENCHGYDSSNIIHCTAGLFTHPTESSERESDQPSTTDHSFSKITTCDSENLSKDLDLQGPELSKVKSFDLPPNNHKYSPERQLKERDSVGDDPFNKRDPSPKSYTSIGRKCVTEKSPYDKDYYPYRSYSKDRYRQSGSKDRYDRSHSKDRYRRSHSRDRYDRSHSKDTYSSHSKDRYRRSHSKDRYDRSHSKDTYSSYSKDRYHQSHSKDRYDRSHSKDTYDRSHSKDTYDSSRSKDRYCSSPSKDRYRRSHSKDRYRRSRSKDRYLRSHSKDRYLRSHSKDRYSSYQPHSKDRHSSHKDFKSQYHLHEKKYGASERSRSPEKRSGKSFRQSPSKKEGYSYHKEEHKSKMRSPSSNEKRDEKQYSSHGESRRKSPEARRSKPDDDESEHEDGRSPSVDSKKDKPLSDTQSPSHTQESGSPADTKVETTTWIRSSPADLYYTREKENPKIVKATEKLEALHRKFRYVLVERAERVRATKPRYEPPPRKVKLRKPKPPKAEGESASSTSEESSSEEEDTAFEELERKKMHPDRLHEELWYNDPGEMNDGPLCRCSAKARRAGIRHGIYAGEGPLERCDPTSNNAHRLFHYRITMSPHTNFMSKNPTTIKHDGHEFTFEGFSLFSHSELSQLPRCKVIRFNIEYTILYTEEQFPENFTVEGLELFSDYLFLEILELVDLSWKAHADKDGCPRFHFMPRFSRELEDNGKELLSMDVVLMYLLKSNQVLIDGKHLRTMIDMDQHKWQDMADEVKGMIVTCPGKKPSSIRVDQLDREGCDPNRKIYPEIVHFGVRPPQLSYAGNPSYQKAWRDYVKFRHLLANKPKVVYSDRHKLLQKEMKLQEMRMKSNLKRDVTVVVSSRNFYKTGIMCDIVQHAMLLPVLVCHLRFHQLLDVLEEKIGCKFVDRYLLQLALTHPSYRENFGTNPDHARNSLTNCGIRQPEYGDRRIHYLNTRKRGINTLISIMSRFGRREETTSCINHNERLEFLGDAVVEFLSSIHLFYMFPNLEEGGLATYRAAIVQNQHLAVLSKKLQLEKFMLYAHGSDLCHDLELRHAMANCFEALMGALFLDQGIEVADKVFSQTLFMEPELLEVWVNYPPHPLQEQEPSGDRKWISSVPVLQKLHLFEEATGIEFTHVRLLARAFTHRSIGFNNLTLGSNQRLEFLGDTVLQLVASEYLYKYFPEHHEGHLSLLRSSLVNNRTQSVVCDDLGMVEYAIYPFSKVELKTKDRADLLEAFLGALYVDKDLDYCRKFCEVCFFPRLQDFIMNQDWNDPKSKLQQCCLTLRTMDGGEPDIPVYKVIECKGPTNTRVYTVAVYFQGHRLAAGSGHSIQQAEMDAASNALKASKDLFPQLNHQRRAIERSLKQKRCTSGCVNK